MKKAHDYLTESAAIHKKRGEVYGDSYKTFGRLVKALFPNGLFLTSETDFTRFGVLTQIMSKLHRYCNNFTQAGHEDSLVDLSTYSAMLNELDSELRDAITHAQKSLCEQKQCDMEFDLSSQLCRDCMADARQ
jgi:hypothetical protein